MKVPEGYVKLEAFSNGKWLVVLGDPPDENFDPEGKWHDCDAMGCNSLGDHVLYRASVNLPWINGKGKL